MTAIPAFWVAAGQGVPTVCARHGQAATTPKKCQFMSKPPGWSYLLILVGVLAFLIAVMVTRKTVKAPIWPFCDTCRSGRTRWLAIGLGVAAVSAVAMVAGIALPSAGSPDSTGTASDASSWGVGMFVVGLLGLCVGLLVAARANWVTVAGGVTSPDGQWVTFPKAHPAFAAQVQALLAGAPAPAADLAAPLPTYGQQYPYSPG
jgi:hypothetical protein